MQVRGNHLVKVVPAGLIVGVVLCCGITAGNDSTTRLVKPRTVVPERGEDEGGVITVKVVDRDGKAVIGAGVYQWYIVHEGRKATAEFVCNEDGVVNLPSGEVFKYERQEEAMVRAESAKRLSEVGASKGVEVVLLGMRLVDLTEELRTRYGLAYAKGVVVLDAGFGYQRLDIGKVSEGDCFIKAGYEEISGVRDMIVEILRVNSLPPPKGGFVEEGYEGHVRVVYGYRDSRGTNTQYMKLGLDDVMELRRAGWAMGISDEKLFPGKVVESADRIDSARMLERLGKAFLLYTGDHEERYPDSLDAIKQYIKDEEQLRWLIVNVEYLAKGKGANISPWAPLAYDKSLLAKGKGTNVLYNDISVIFEKPQRLAKLGISDEKLTVSKAGKIVERIDSAKMLERLGKVMLMYASDHGDKYPDEIGKVNEYLQSSKDLEWLLANVQYTGRGKSATDSPDAQLAYDKVILRKGEGTNVLFNDCHVRFEKPQRLAKLGISKKDEPASGLLKTVTVVPQRGEDEGGVITVKVVDRDGKAVVGAGVYQWYIVHEGRKATAEFVCNEDGVVNLPSGEVFKYERQEEAMLYGLWEDKLAGFVKVSRGAVGSEVELRLEQACRVYGELKSSTLAELGQEIEWTTVYLFVDDERPMSCMGKQMSYEFFVPAGEYKLYGHGARNYGVQKEIVVSAGQAELEAELDFPAYRLAYLIGKKAPKLSKIKGWINTEAIMLSSLNGKVVLLDFWGWWCGPCVGSMPKLMDLHEKYHEKGLVIIAVHDDSLDSVDMLRDKLTELKDERWDGREIPFAVALDGGGNMKIEGTTRSARGATTAAYGIQAWPTMVLIDKQGKVVREYDRGGRDTELLEKLLGI